MCDFQNTNLRSHAEDKKNDALDDLFNTPEALNEEKILEADLDSSIHGLDKISDDYLEDFLDINQMEETFDEEKTLETTSTTSFLYTHISSIGHDELNENLTNLQNKTGLVLTTGSTATY